MEQRKTSRRAFVRETGRMCAGVLLGPALGMTSGCQNAGPDGRSGSYDVVVYGATSSGIAAAVQVARMGKSVILIEPSGHVGGLTTGGLGATDAGDESAIGGIAKEFYGRIRSYYHSNPSVWRQESLAQYLSHVHPRGIDEDAMWFFEPHVALHIYHNMLREASVPVLRNERLDLGAGVGVEKRAGRIMGIVTESGNRFVGKTYIDATYEGDLMAKAGVSYTIGREGTEQYGESLNGIRLHRHMYNFHMFARWVDPYVVPGDSTSGLIPGVTHPEPPGRDGEGDHRVQSYCFRLCMTDVKDNQVPFPKPEGYDSARYELLLRYLISDDRFPWVTDDRFRGIENPVLGWDPRIILMPNRKTDANTKGPISFNHTGANYDYPDGNYSTRQRIVDDHKAWQQGLFWFMANDARVPAEFSDPVQEWGLAADEFTDTDHWPPQLYIREARRMVSDEVVTEHHCLGNETAQAPVGLGSYAMDSHIVSRYVTDEGYVSNEGHVGRGVPNPYPIGYGSIVPRSSECTNLLVPVCVSATHVAFGSIRMEPVFMVLGQSAGAAAALAADTGINVQDVPYSSFQSRMQQDGQVLNV